MPDQKNEEFSDGNAAAGDGKGCIYCGEAAVSDEHIFGKWLNKKRPAKNRTSTKLIVINTGIHSIIQPRMPSTKNGGIFTTKSRRVCISCNGGWLSKIQSATKPAVEKLISDEVVELSPEELVALRAWAVNASLLLDLSDARTSATLKSDFAHFYLHQTPPIRWRIWVGRYKGKEWVGGKSRHVGGAAKLITEPDHSTYNFQLSIWNVDPVFFLVVSAHDDRYLPNFSRFEKFLKPIWPEQRAKFVWPTTFIAGDSEMEEMTRFML
ncbi:hypothetical protein [Variovorax sp. OK605]|uniref:hypothetical protein n=1 Tax=Variovorax sp. OK605 TaxID=1855317 RepID=UPI0011608F93|nr:hypothetical protein [Variovorax sp. OK605]